MYCSSMIDHSTQILQIPELKRHLHIGTGYKEIIKSGGYYFSNPEYDVLFACSPFSRKPCWCQCEILALPRYVTGKYLTL